MQYFIIFFLLTLNAFGFEYHLKPYKINSKVECFYGLHGEAKIQNGGRVINTCFIETSEGYVVIDSGPTYSYAQQAYQIMQEKKILPVKYVINTSAEELNILGNEFYKEQGAILIGPKAYEERIKKQETLTLLEKISNKIFFNTRLIPLDIYQNSDKNITLGNVKIEIKKFEKNDSKNLVVYLENQQTIFVGNFVANDSLPKMKEHYSLQEWMGTLKKIEKMSWEYLISSHGVKGSKNALQSTQAYLRELKENIITSIKENNPKIKTLQDVKLSSYSHLAFYNDFHTDNIKQAYNECKELTPMEENKKTLSNEEQMVMASMSKIHIQRTMPPNLSKKTDKKEVIPLQQQLKIIQNKNIKKPHEIIAQTMLKASNTPPVHTAFIPNIKYTNFLQAQADAIREHKYILIKVEANHCKPCDQLNTTLSTNDHLKKMINDHAIAVKINTSFDNVPLGLTNRGTPTVFLIEAATERVLVKLEPEEIGELEVSLNDFLHSDTKNNIMETYVQPKQEYIQPKEKIVGLKKLESLNQSLNQLIDN